jgi:hypothetical protein
VLGACPCLVLLHSVACQAARSQLSASRSCSTIGLLIWRSGAWLHSIRLFPETVADRDKNIAKPLQPLRRATSLALLWQIFSVTGFPNQFFCDSWAVGFWRADHEEHIIGLGSRACPVVEGVSGPFGPQGAAADVPGLCIGTDRSAAPTADERAIAIKSEAPPSKSGAFYL